MYLFYLIKCKDSSLYAGVSYDVKRRFAKHKNSKGG
ncbi:MAG: GIY-YIG nuclease family protein, partial [Candidatus Colwellbacteria bacterium]|nr:GIY-YIG nuclease family protein [Candidatus Colwellbacteria bacterium]